MSMTTKRGLERAKIRFLSATRHAYAVCAKPLLATTETPSVLTESGSGNPSGTGDAGITLVDSPVAGRNVLTPRESASNNVWSFSQATAATAVSSLRTDVGCRTAANETCATATTTAVQSGFVRRINPSLPCPRDVRGRRRSPPSSASTLLRQDYSTRGRYS